MTDPIADMLTRIRNAVAVRKSTVVVPHSRMKKHIADILAREGYVDTVAVVPQGRFFDIVISLRYDQDTTRAIQALKRISKPGCRRYVGQKHIPSVLNNYGIMILSTSRGLMTNREARKNHIGGEVICEVY